MKHLHIVLWGLLLALIPIPITAQVNPAADEAILRQMSPMIAQAYNAGDAGKLVEMHTANSITQSPSGESLAGQDALRRYYRSLFAQGGKRSLNLAPMQLKIQGDMSWEGGRWLETVKTPDGKTQEIAGSYLTVCKKEGGKWRIVADTWTPDAKPMAQRQSSPQLH